MIVREAVPQDAESIARVHVDAWRETYFGIIPNEYLASLSYMQRFENWKKNLTRPEPGELYLVADDERDGVIGFAASGRERDGNTLYTGELYAVYLLKAYLGRGTGRRLVSETAKGLVERGHGAMLVWVLEDNPARFFYEKLGGEKIGVKTINLGGKDLIEAAYGWKDIRTLAAFSALNRNSVHGKNNHE